LSDRELAVQVCEEINRLASALKGFTSVPVYGGAPIDRQMRALRKGAHVVVGTPGRVMDHLRRKTLRTDAISLCILDEADRMLDMGFPRGHGDSSSAICPRIVRHSSFPQQ
jgi:ATP-dependent RNA helicase DeaD